MKKENKHQKVFFLYIDINEHVRKKQNQNLLILYKLKKHI